MSAECCLGLAKKVSNLIDSKDFCYVSVRPRKSLEFPVIVACFSKINEQTISVCYFPREDTWCRLNVALS